MNAAVFLEPNQLIVTNIKKPKRRSDEVLVRIKANGICGTDLGVYRGEYDVNFPIIAGHEATGYVEEVSRNLTRFKRGDRVLINPVYYCGQCEFCKQGKQNICPGGGLLGRDRDGVLAEYVSLPQCLLFRLPDKVEFEEATVAQLLSTVLHGFRRITLEPGSTVLVIGQGASGLLFTRLAKLSGASLVIAVSRTRWKLDLAKRFGADEVLNAREEAVGEIVNELTAGEGCEIVIESAGVQSTILQSLKLVKRGGLILLFGVPSAPINGFDTRRIYYKEVNIVSSRAATPYDVKSAMRLISSGAIDLRPLVSRVFPLNEVGDAFRLLARKPGEALRLVITV